MNLGPSPKHVVSVSLILNVHTSMVYPQLDTNNNDFFETIHPTAGNPSTYSNWKALSGLIKNNQSVRGNINTAPQRT